MIKSKCPALKDGQMLDLISTNYRKGVLLKIEYLNADRETYEEKIYLMTAKYSIRKKQLEVISFKETQDFVEKKVDTPIEVND